MNGLLVPSFFKLQFSGLTVIVEFVVSRRMCLSVSRCVLHCYASRKWGQFAGDATDGSS